METHTIDANGKRLGRIASQAASVLSGKAHVGYSPEKVHDVEVHVINASKLDVTLKKLDEEKHSKYSGYPGGLKFTSLKETVNKKGYGELVRKAVYGMLASNRLRDKKMKRLIITE